MNFPLRAVIRAWRDNDWTHYWHCLMDCGHTEIATKQSDKPPKKAGCRQCWREKRGLSK